MKKIMVIIAVIVFLIPLSVFGEPPPCEEDVIIVKMDLGNGPEDVFVPSVVGDLSQMQIAYSTKMHDPDTKVEVALMVVWQGAGHPPCIMLFDTDLRPRVVTLLISKDVRLDWIYVDGCPVFATGEEVDALAEKLKMEANNTPC
jgi:hypothetical protein